MSNSNHVNPPTFESNGNEYGVDSIKRLQNSEKARHGGIHPGESKRQSKPVAMIHEPEKEQRDGGNHYPENIMTSGTTGAHNDEVSRGVKWEVESGSSRTANK
ncbi:hypothetical protein N7532_011248 [Penicillium argentinense]|uniref:Uncharacterized protein n=1 Tax=Penicillium argentinense TaxID=1131581 RepID=A0A9W9EI71_9EURO|nr:uncharacterized protein N7532_011248 [Penicillium argentinense]KAJ5082205.1 hypothetical protein N7532_011248 [Penicillium argentinense]